MEVLSRHCSSRNSEAKFSSLLLSWSVARRSCRSIRVMTGLCDLASEKSMSWPAIGDICLGTRMVPVLSVAKESPAPAARTGPAARCGCAQCFLGSANVHMKLTDRGWKEAFVFRVVDVSFSSLSNRARAD